MSSSREARLPAQPQVPWPPVALFDRDLVPHACTDQDPEAALRLMKLLVTAAAALRRHLVIDARRPSTPGSSEPANPFASSPGVSNPGPGSNLPYPEVPYGRVLTGGIIYVSRRYRIYAVPVRIPRLVFHFIPRAPQGSRGIRAPVPPALRRACGIDLLLSVLLVLRFLRGAVRPRRVALRAFRCALRESNAERGDGGHSCPDLSRAIPSAIPKYIGFRFLSI